MALRVDRDLAEIGESINLPRGSVFTFTGPGTIGGSHRDNLGGQFKTLIFVDVSGIFLIFG